VTPTSKLEVLSPDGGDPEAQSAYQALEKHRQEKRKKSVRRGIIVAAVAAGIVAVALVARSVGSSSTNAMSSMDTDVVTRGTFTSTVTASGAVEPVSSTNVTPEVDGIIDTVKVSVGDTVEAGDVLFTLKNDTLDKAVNDAAQQVKTAQNGVDSAQTAYENAINAYNSAADAYNKTIATGQVASFDKATLQGAINSADVARDGANIALQTANEAYDEAVATADKRTVTAPAAGTIIAVNAVAGTAVSSGATMSTTATAPLIQISDVSQMKVTVQANELDVSKLAVGQAAKATFSALPNVTSDAAITNIATTATAATATSTSTAASGTGVTTYAVDLLIPSPDAALKPGMTASVAITTLTLPDVLMVPAAAVQTGGDGTAYVSVLTDPQRGTTDTRVVSVKATSTSQAAIEGNVSEGDTVVLPSSATSGTSSSAEGL
jgi:HlyD family secretion protein